MKKEQHNVTVSLNILTNSINILSKVHVTFMNNLSSCKVTQQETDFLLEDLKEFPAGHLTASSTGY